MSVKLLPGDEKILLPHITFFSTDDRLAYTWRLDAQRIRMRLAPWPEAVESPNWRIYVGNPLEAGKDDFILREVASQCAIEDSIYCSLIARGATVLFSRVLNDGHVLDELHWCGMTYRLLSVADSAFLPALAAFLDCGFDALDAVCLARAWRSDNCHAEIGSELGDWPVKLETFPKVMDLIPSPGSFPFCPSSLGVYPIFSSADGCEAMAKLGVKTVQLRIKSMNPNELRKQIARTVLVGLQVGGAYFINDHWRLAADEGAYGVHLGQEDILGLSANDIAELFLSGMRLGISTHGYYEILAAHHFRPSYLAVGAVFPTVTKVIATAPQGLEKLVRFVRLIQPYYPVVAIGGIDVENLSMVLATGVGGAAVVRALTGGGDMEEMVARMQTIFKEQN
ncbi:thiamine phosphate synthase [Candidatus Pandoraea novymonadis]|uniref:Thiamine-phosphate synthase n=1 Tax=Candidatus Pandoraea novymonadis TaxID=1808959 RepID=A0ABX5FEI7_9BURK|nr:thiamine phosphate synthase [Candidatus Pandoraea novymonadis]PSB91567.1 Thiamine-phosphate synthase [Candidatus Pandoraea novymonadis]